ncbi:MAG TPA: hypothetical protein VM925_33115, partial [Labilithrix sp.]|nr:hypothetical protein [Labilithrix sp.]
NAAAEQAALNLAASAQNSRAHSDANNSSNNSATNSAVNVATSAFDTVSKGDHGKAGFGKGGFGFFDFADQSSFSKNTLFDHVRSSRASNQHSDVDNDAFAKALDTSFSKVFQNSRQSSFNKVNSADRATNRSKVHNDARNATAYDQSDTIDTATESHDRFATSDRATTRNDLFRKTRANSTDLVDTSSLAASQNKSDQTAESKSINSAKNEAKSQRYTALSNLSEFKSRHLVLKLNVISNTESAIVRVFTGNKANNVAANQDFSQSFSGCGAAMTPKKASTIVPVVAPAAEEAEALQLGDRVAKPE